MLLVLVVTVLGLTLTAALGGAVSHSGGGTGATPPEKAPTATDELAAMVQDVRGATAVRYDVRDSAGHPMETAKIIADPSGGYLAVYHFRRDGVFAIGLARSADLLHWTYLRDLGEHASQPYITALSTGGFVVGWERHAGGYRQLSFRYYASRAHLLAGNADRSFDAPHTQVPAGRYAEGTPNIYAVTPSRDIDHSTIDVGFHYFRDGEVDRQARGTLRGFSGWETHRVPAVDAAIEAEGVAGNIGDRDSVVWRHGRYDLVEGQRDRGDFGSWRIFLWDRHARNARELTIRTHGGTSAFANPAVTVLRGPGGRRVLVGSLFLPREGAGPGEAGQLIYYRAGRRPASLLRSQPLSDPGTVQGPTG